MEIVMTNRTNTTSTRRILAAGLPSIIAVLLFGLQPAAADDAGNADITANGCMQDVYTAFGQGGTLNCTANDVSLATATNIEILEFSYFVKLGD